MHQQPMHQQPMLQQPILHQHILHQPILHQPTPTKAMLLHTPAHTHTAALTLAHTPTHTDGKSQLPLYNSTNINPIEPEQEQKLIYTINR